MNSKSFATLTALAVFGLCVWGIMLYWGSHRIGSERDGTWPEYFVRDTAAFHKSLVACEHISPAAVFVNGSKVSLRSECIQILAIATQNEKICDGVSPLLFNEYPNRDKCRELVVRSEFSDKQIPTSVQIEDLYALIGYDVGTLAKTSGVAPGEQYWDSLKQKGPDAETLKLIENYNLSINIDHQEFISRKIKMKCDAGVITSSVICSGGN